MKAGVDLSKCQAHGMCNVTFPEFFTLDDEGFSSIGTDKPVPVEWEQQVRRGVAACPVQALSITED
ncbi:ferredoxin [[Mycobacterium] vasticus]|uniref:ferredoxin n=1 Tax=[Mycobacterium] vasticus TaxID=2875777 RepID=UPI0038B4FA24